MPTLSANLDISRCPHCSIDRPNLTSMTALLETRDHKAEGRRVWHVYNCARCGGVVVASAMQSGAEILEMHPTPPAIAEALPPLAKSYLEQAVNSLHAPAGAVMLAASCVDAMLKAKEYRSGSLYERINKAAEDRLITREMAQWAHDIRLDANDQRHVDEQAVLPDAANARKCVDFATALGEFLFVLPARVERGLADANPPNV